MERLLEFSQFLQSCITPVALISGVGLLLLTITNRLGRTIDRTRQLVAELDQKHTERKDQKVYEIRILYIRSTYLKNSIGAIVISIIFSCLIIPILFILNIYSVDLRIPGYLFFIISILFIFISCIFFFLDIMLSLKAVKLEAENYL